MRKAFLRSFRLFFLRGKTLNIHHFANKFGPLLTKFWFFFSFFCYFFRTPNSGIPFFGLLTSWSPTNALLKSNVGSYSSDLIDQLVPERLCEFTLNLGMAVTARNWISLTRNIFPCWKKFMRSCIIMTMCSHNFMIMSPKLNFQFNLHLQGR